MAVKVKKKGELHVSVGGSIVKAGRFEGEGSPLEGTAKELQAVNNTNAPIGSEFLDLVTGNTYVKIDNTPEITQGAYKKGVWVLSGGSSNGGGGGDLDEYIRKDTVASATEKGGVFFDWDSDNDIMTIDNQPL